VILCCIVIFIVFCTWQHEHKIRQPSQLGVPLGERLNLETMEVDKNTRKNAINNI
jgi:hypothetical protein